MFIGIYNLPFFITLIGLLLSVSSTLLAINGQLNFAMVCLIFSGIADLFDGLVARKLTLNTNEKDYGKQIDSIVDAISFGAVPIIIAYFSGLSTLLSSPILFLYVTAVVIRLAYFNIVGLDENEQGKKYYIGLPVTYVALILPLIYLLSFLVPLSIFELIWSSTFLILSLFYLLKVRIPKPGGLFYILFPVMAITVSCGFIYLEFKGAV